jgi:hypothetical protein
VILNAGTYFLHPNFCLLDLSAGFLPESNRYNYLVTPDFSEVRTVKKASFSSTFFSQRKVNVMASGSYDESYARRENMTDLKTINKYIGGSVHYGNKYIPVSLDVFRRKMDQTEIQTGRKLNTDQFQLEGTILHAERQAGPYLHSPGSLFNE